MNTRTTKVLAAACAALALVGSLAISTKDAEARRWHRGYGYGAAGLGIAAAIIGTAAIAAAASQPAPTCRVIRQYDRWGNVVGYREVC